MSDQLPNKDGWKEFEQAKLNPNDFLTRFKKAEIKVSGHAHKFVVNRFKKMQAIRRPIIIWILLIAAILLGSGVQSFIGRNRYVTVAGSNQSSFLEGIVGRITSLNPLYATTEADRLVYQLVFSRLYNYDSTGSLKGDLAKSVVVSDNELIYTIILHDDIKWHDGESLTANDVKFTVDLFKNQALGSFVGQLLRGVSVKVVSDYTIEFNLRARYAPFLHLLDFAILPQHILSKVNHSDLRNHEFNTKPIGSGKYKVKSLKQNVGIDSSSGQQILSLTHQDQADSNNVLKRFELHTYKDRAALAKGLEAGEVNAIATNMSLDSALNKNHFKKQVIPINSGVFAFYNLERSRMQNLQLRQVLRLAMQVEELRQIQFNQDNVLSEMDWPILPNQDSLKETLGFDIDPVMKEGDADSIMTTLGYSRGADRQWRDSNNQLLEFDLVSVSGSSYQSVAEYVARKLSEFGCKINLRLIDVVDDKINQAHDIFKLKKYDILIYEINLSADPDVYSFWHSSQRNEDGFNFSNYNNKVVDDLLSTARLKRNHLLRALKYQAFVQQWQKDIPAVGLLQSNLYYYSTLDSQGPTSDSVLVNIEDRYFNIDDWYSTTRLIYNTP